MTQRLTNQLNDVLFPTVVDNSAADRTDRLQTIFVQGTRLSLGTVIPIGGAIMLMAGPLVRAWVGPEFSGSVLVLRLLSLVVIVRVGNATAATVLKGAGEHRLVAFTNIGAALVNLALGIALVRPLGLAGVAIAHAHPGRRRVHAGAVSRRLPPRAAVAVSARCARRSGRRLWPAAVMTAFVLATRDLVPVTLVRRRRRDGRRLRDLRAGLRRSSGSAPPSGSSISRRSPSCIRRRVPRRPVSEGA